MKTRRLDFFEDPARWLAVPSGGSMLRLSPDRGALRMDFDFKGGRGFVVARREAGLAMPPEFVLRFKLRGRGPVNHFEIKLVDESGRNVWRHERRNLRPPARWREMRIGGHEFDFAWGPAGGGGITKAGALEFAVVAGEGGAGSVWLDDLRIEDHSLTRAPAVSFSSAARPPKSSLEQVSGWIPEPADRHPWLAIDLHDRRLLGGLVIDWRDRAPARGFRISGSNDGARWRTLRVTKQAGGSRSHVCLPGTRTRHLRIASGGPAGIRALRWQGFEFSRSPEAFWHHVAADGPRGWHPRWLMREQSLWTPAGIPDGRSCALINEEGMIEVAEGSFSVEPFVEVNRRLFTWADVKLRQELRDGWRPVPSVIWTTEEWTMQLEAEPKADGSVCARHHFVNLTGRTLQVRLLATMRPFQVTPPWQHFRNVGGLGRIHDLKLQDGGVRVNDAISIFPDDAFPVSFGAQTFDEGLLLERLSKGGMPERDAVHDEAGFGSGVLAFSLTLEAGGEAETGWSTSRERPAHDPWPGKIPVGRIQCAGWGAEALNAMLTATAHILVTRSGPALQPGPRRYTRSWIRDGTIMCAALLRMGCAAEVREFIEWYAAFVREDGFVPCCVDRDGPDWLVEHDSHGQFLALIADYVRLTGDEALPAGQWPRIVKTADFIGRIIEPTGLLPVSVSHEGYLAQPVHSCWDDFWAVRGLRDAADVAGRLHHHTEAMRWREVAGKLRAALLASIESTRAGRQLDYIPGSLEWADFDPTATANAVMLADMEEGHSRPSGGAPCREHEECPTGPESHGSPGLDGPALMRTFDRYLIDWRKKRGGGMAWSHYSPYEIRIIGALVRLGRREDALELLRFFLSDRRPPAWNQWPEIAWRDPRSPGHIGDVPHTWIGAEHVLAVQSLFAFESGSRRAIVIAAGIAAGWMDGDGVRVKELPTSRGLLSYSLRRFPGGLILFEACAGLDLPAGGLLLRPPLTGPVWRVTVNDEVIEARGAEEIRIDVLPAAVAIHPLSHA